MLVASTLAFSRAIVDDAGPAPDGQTTEAPPRRGDRLSMQDLSELNVIGMWDARLLPGEVDVPVGSWPDGASRQAPLAQPASESQPTIDDSGFGGMRSLLFTESFLTNRLDQTYAGDFAIIAVIELLTFPAGSANAIYSTGTVEAFEKNLLAVDGEEACPAWVVMSGPDGTPAQHHAGASSALVEVPGRYVLTQLVRNDGELKLWENLALVIDEPEAAGGAPLNDLAGVVLGCREDATRCANARLGYLLLVDMATVSEAQLLEVRNQLGVAFSVPGFDPEAVT